MSDYGVGPSIVKEVQLIFVPSACSKWKTVCLEFTAFTCYCALSERSFLLLLTAFLGNRVFNCDLIIRLVHYFKVDGRRVPVWRGSLHSTTRLIESTPDLSLCINGSHGAVSLNVLQARLSYVL